MNQIVGPVSVIHEKCSFRALITKTLLSINDCPIVLLARNYQHFNSMATAVGADKFGLIISSEINLSALVETHAASSTTLVVVSPIQTQKAIAAAISMGARGYICQKASKSQIKLALSTIINGGQYFAFSDLSPSALPNSAEVQQIKLARGELARTLGISPKQYCVLELLGRGDSNQIIAHNLGISEHTVRVHVSAILKKFSVTNRTAAAVKWRNELRKAELQLLDSDISQQ